MIKHKHNEKNNINQKKESTQNEQIMLKSTHSSSGVVGVLQEITLCCDEILFEIILSAGTEILLENSAFVLFKVLDFLCLLFNEKIKFKKIQ